MFVRSPKVLNYVRGIRVYKTLNSLALSLYHSIFLNSFIQIQFCPLYKIVSFVFLVTDGKRSYIREAHGQRC